MLRKTRLVGRALLQSQLEEVRRTSASGNFRCAVLSGDPGVGKSRLAAECLAAGRRSSIPLVARAYPLGETAPMGLWAEAFEGYLRNLPSEEVVRLCGGFLDDLAGLLRSVAAVTGSAPIQEPPRQRLLQGLAALLANLSKQAPVQIVLDDLHLADASSWEALHYFARSLYHERILVVASARAAELDSLPIAREVLSWLEKDRILLRLSVPPLDRQAVGELAESFLGEEPSPSLVDWLVDQSRGNAMYAISLLQALVEQGADLDSPHLRSLPEALAGVVKNQLEGLDEAALATLELMAVVGQRVEFDELVRLSSRPPERLERILHKLVRSRLVVDEERGRSLTYEIAHPLIREVIFESIGPARRRAVHRLVGRALQAAGRLGAAAPHFVRSAGIEDDEAVEALSNAVRQAEEREAFQEALTILGFLVELLPAGDVRWLKVGDALSRSPDWVLFHRADAHAYLGLEAMRHIDRVLDRTGDAGRRAAVKFRLASFLSWGTGELDEAEARCREALTLFQQAGDGRSALLAATELAWLASLQGNLAESASRAAVVMEQAAKAGEMEVVMQAGAVKGYQDLAMGTFAEAEAAVRQTVEIARNSGNDYGWARGLAALALTVALQGRIPEALSLLDQARRVYPRYVEVVVLEWSAMVAWFAGDFAGALRFAEEALAANPGGLSRRRGYGLLFAAGAAAETGNLRVAEALARKARGLYGRQTWSFCSDYATWAEAQVLWGKDRPEEALEMLQPAARSVLRMQAWPWAAPMVADEAELAWLTGRSDDVARAAQDLQDIANKVDRDLYRGIAALGEAWSLLAVGRRSTAAEAADRALGLLSATGCQSFTARAHDARGRALARIDREEAVRALERAAALFDESSAVVRKERTLQALAGLGTRGRRAAAGARGAVSLTAREREIVRLAKQGLTAKEIGSALFIGSRTVETHLSNAYAKLGINSKMQLLTIDPDRLT
ncbi:MAG TPA: AAA family ATPase [Actinomycetota bacterium]|nr:AAA family ATPase [Actinomycetota bacterium]